MFWEVKLERDARMVARGEPHIVRQLQLYRDFLVRSEQQVRGAYTQACQVLVRLSEQAAMMDNAATLARGVTAVAEGAPLCVDPEPRLVVHTSGARRADVWSDHVARLREEFGLDVTVVEQPEPLSQR